MTTWLTENQTITALRGRGFFLPLGLIQGTETSPAGQLVVCDYRSLTEYEAAWQIAVYSTDGERLLARINVLR